MMNLKKYLKIYEKKKMHSNTRIDIANAGIGVHF